jgi:hypothetical protein
MGGVVLKILNRFELRKIAFGFRTNVVESGKPDCPVWVYKIKAVPPLDIPSIADVASFENDVIDVLLLEEVARR